MILSRRVPRENAAKYGSRRNQLWLVPNDDDDDNEASLMFRSMDRMTAHRTSTKNDDEDDDVDKTKERTNRRCLM
jgi:hypothetical protein